MISGAAVSSSAVFLPHRRPLRPLRRRLRPISAVSDPVVLKIADRLEDSLLPSPLLAPLRDSAALSLLSSPWPTHKSEPFRFTDTSFLKSADVTPAKPAPENPATDSPFENLLVITDGHLTSTRTSLPAGVYAGPLSGIPASGLLDKIQSAVGSGTGDLFSDLNAAGAPDVVVVYVPEGVRVEEPVHVVVRAREGGEKGTGRVMLSSPRMVVVVEKGAEVGVVEEYVEVEGNEEGCYWANAVMEIVVGEGGRVRHCYVQRQSKESAHIKWTFCRQEASSTYELFEVSTGGKLSRHNLDIQQLGPDTETEMSAFHLLQNDQIQDLHSRLVLEHPKGHARQIHKCIVSNSSGHAVFDGAIVASRYAVQTDAGQLSRALLLAPRATVNLKPNLQIVQPDVKCSHGATISDLDKNQLFYFQVRGIDEQTARDALVFSFGAEVISKIPFKPVRESVTVQIKELLESGRGKR